MWDWIFIIGCGIAASIIIAFTSMLLGMLRQGMVGLMVASFLMVPFGILLVAATVWSLAAYPPNCPNNIINTQIWLFGCSLISLGIAMTLSGIQQIGELAEMAKWDF